MAIRYCVYCQRLVNARRHVGVFTWIMGIFFFFLWFFFIPFYKKRCPICGGTDFLPLASAAPPPKREIEPPRMNCKRTSPREDEADYTHRLFDDDEIIDLTEIVPSSEPSATTH